MILRYDGNPDDLIRAVKGPSLNISSPRSESTWGVNVIQKRLGNW
jgi:hypothetical protein